MDGREDKSFEEIHTALREYFSPEVALTGSLLALRAGNTTQAADWLGQAAEKLDALCKEKGKKHPPEYFEIRLFQGRVADLLGRGSEAQAHYRAVADHPDLEDANIQRIARKRRTYRPKDVEKLMMPFSSYVPFT